MKQNQRRSRKRSTRIPSSERMENLYTKVKRFAEEKGIVREGDNILVALSGGPDSVFLFHFFVYLSGKINVSVKAAYVHHHLRKEADRELEFVRELVKAYSIPFFYRNIKIKGKAGIEEQARTKRYRALYSVAKKANCNRIAVGHTLDDQAETVVMRFIKGAGLAGLRGILPEKYLFKNKEVSIIRPLLCLEKKEILEALEKTGKDYRIDRSNFTEDFLRNRIRSEVLPLLLKYNPQVKKKIAQMSFLVQDDFAFIERCAEKLLGRIYDRQHESIDVKAYRKLDVSVRRAAAALLVKRITGSPYRSFNRISKITRYLDSTPRRRVQIKDIIKL